MNDNWELFKGIMVTVIGYGLGLVLLVLMMAGVVGLLETIAPR